MKKKEPVFVYCLLVLPYVVLLIDTRPFSSRANLSSTFFFSFDHFIVFFCITSKLCGPPLAGPLERFVMLFEQAGTRLRLSFNTLYRNVQRFADGYPTVGSSF